MNKTGIAITVTSNGVGQPVVANPGEWTRHIGDIRPVLSRVSTGGDNSPHPLIYMTFSTTGTYITVARAISGRLGDNVAAWLYIPDKIDIRGEEVSRIIERLSQITGADRLPDESALAEEFAECYAPAAAMPRVFASDPHGPLALRRIGADGLDELAGTFRRMAYYADYCGVVLAYGDQTVADAVDLSDYPLDDCEEENNDIITDEPATNAQTAGQTPTAGQCSGARPGLCRQWQPYALGAAGGFILGLIVSWAAGFYNSHSFRLRAAWPPIEAVAISPAIADSCTTAPADSVAAPAGFSARELAEATAYLDTHPVWKKSDMDSIAAIAGLWDAVNECRYDAVNEYRMRLDGSESLNAVADTLREFVPNVLYGVPLNDSTDTEITIANYGGRMRAAAASMK